MTSVMSMRKMLRDKGTSAPPGSVHPFVLLPVWGNATHESGWTHGTLGIVRSGLRWTASCSRSSYAWGVHNVQNPEQFIGHAASTPISRSLQTYLQINRELQDVHLTLRRSKDGQGQERFLPSSWIRTVHKRRSRMEHSPPMLRQAQVRCYIVGSECRWRRVWHEPL